MKNTLMTTAAFVAFAFAATPAFADYTIYEDTRYPSVLYVEIEGGAAPQATVINAPSGGGVSPFAPGASGNLEISTGDDPVAPSAAAETNGQQGADDQSDNAGDRVAEIGENIAEDPAKALEDDQIEDQLFDDAGLR